jgi:oligoribonuclease NrnB/cAMP/cGMP phosphodiesterase (DHH superfamily)
MSKPLVIHHGSCLDGYTSLWVVNKALEGEIEPYAGYYNRPPPDVTNRHVIIVDFSYPRPILLDMAKQALSILILDHHNTAAEDLQGFITPPPWEGWAFGMKTILSKDEQLAESSRIATIFDMKRSGAGITWDYFFKGEKRLRVIDHVEDRDLWKFSLPYTEEINAFLFSFPYKLNTYNDLMTRPLGEMIQAGMAIKRKHNKDVAELVEAAKRTFNIAGYQVPVANLPYTLASDAGNIMAKDQPFAACFMLTVDGVVFSLRSAPEGINVEDIARKYGEKYGKGGGGHVHSSGFTIPYDQLGKTFDLITGDLIIKNEVKNGTEEKE